MIRIINIIGVWGRRHTTAEVEMHPGMPLKFVICQKETCRLQSLDFTVNRFFNEIVQYQRYVRGEMLSANVSDRLTKCYD